MENKNVNFFIRSTLQRPQFLFGQTILLLFYYLKNFFRTWYNIPTCSSKNSKIISPSTIRRPKNLFFKQINTSGIIEVKFTKSNQYFSQKNQFKLLGALELHKRLFKYVPRSCTKIYNQLCMYVLVYTPSLLRLLRVFQNQYKQIS